VVCHGSDESILSHLNVHKYYHSFINFKKKKKFFSCSLHEIPQCKFSIEVDPFSLKKVKC